MSASAFTRLAWATCVLVALSAVVSSVVAAHVHDEERVLTELEVETDVARVQSVRSAPNEKGLHDKMIVKMSDVDSDSNLLLEAYSYLSENSGTAEYKERIGLRVVSVVQFQDNNLDNEMQPEEVVVTYALGGAHQNPMSITKIDQPITIEGEQILSYEALSPNNIVVTRLNVAPLEYHKDLLDNETAEHDHPHLHASRLRLSSVSEETEPEIVVEPTSVKFDLHVHDFQYQQVQAPYTKLAIQLEVAGNQAILVNKTAGLVTVGGGFLSYVPEALVGLWDHNELHTPLHVKTEGVTPFNEDAYLYAKRLTFVVQQPYPGHIVWDVILGFSETAF